MVIFLKFLCKLFFLRNWSRSGGLFRLLGHFLLRNGFSKIGCFVKVPVLKIGLLYVTVQF